MDKSDQDVRQIDMPEVNADRLEKQSSAKLPLYDNYVDSDSAGFQLQMLRQEVCTKQEWITRLLCEYEERVETLKLSTGELNNLNAKCKLLEAEYQTLSKRLFLETQIELNADVEAELAQMAEPELRAKLLRVAAAYRDERARNADFEKALRGAQAELAELSERQKEFDLLTR